MKKALYTAIFNNRDTIKVNDFINPDYDYLLFTDKITLDCLHQQERIGYSNWEVITIDSIENPRKEARKFKMQINDHLTSYDSTIWIDGAFQQIGDLKHIEDYCDTDFGIMKHPVKSCIYKEALACVRDGLDSAEIIQSQMMKYESEKYPIDNGLVSSGILYRGNSNRVRSINNNWWKEVNNWSIRDQLSFNYVLWKLEEKVDIFTTQFIENIFKSYPHIPKPL